MWTDWRLLKQNFTVFFFFLFTFAKYLFSVLFWACLYLISFLFFNSLLFSKDMLMTHRCVLTHSQSALCLFLLFFLLLHLLHEAHFVSELSWWNAEQSPPPRTKCQRKSEVHGAPKHGEKKAASCTFFFSFFFLLPPCHPVTPEPKFKPCCLCIYLFNFWKLSFFSRSRIAVLWGPNSFCYGTCRPRGPMAVKMRHLKALGFHRVLVRPRSSCWTTKSTNLESLITQDTHVFRHSPTWWWCFLLFFSRWPTRSCSTCLRATGPTS